MNGEELKELRIKMGLSQEAFAPLLGVTFQTINRWESGRNKPSRLAAEQIKNFVNKQKAVDERS